MCLQWAEGTRCYQQGRAKGRAASVVGHGVLSQLLHAWGQASETGYIATHTHCNTHCRFPKCYTFKITGKIAPNELVSQHKPCGPEGSQMPDTRDSHSRPCLCQM